MSKKKKTENVLSISLTRENNVWVSFDLPDGNSPSIGRIETKSNSLESCPVAFTLGNRFGQAQISHRELLTLQRAIGVFLRATKKA